MKNKVIFLKKYIYLLTLFPFFIINHWKNYRKNLVRSFVLPCHNQLMACAVCY